MKLWLGLGIGLLLTACSVISSGEGGEETAAPNDIDGGERAVVVLEDLGPAPELENEVWLNVDEPLRLANLRGSVVLLDMWTFG